MKKITKIFVLSVLGISAMGVFSSCNDFLDIAPTSTITVDNYFNEESQLLAYTAYLYYLDAPLPGQADYVNFFHATDFGMWGDDLYSDDQTNILTNEKFTPDLNQVKASGKNWSFTTIYECNYLLDIALPKWKAGQIKGSETQIKQALGEAYFFRAVAYFRKLERFGDFPIVKHTLNNNRDELLEAAVRAPRNEVARFILADLDSAAILLSPTPLDGKGNRLFSDVATFYKSRVALFEGTFLKYFKGTPFVPQGPEWPGATKAFKDYQYPTGSIDNEIDYFLGIAMEAAKTIVEKYPLVENTGVRLTDAGIVNPYVSLFGDTDLSKYSECILWRAFVPGKRAHNMNRHLARNNAGIGITRSVIRSYVDKNGLPPYASGALWTDKDENSVYTITRNRDSRAQLFIKQPGQINVYLNRNNPSYDEVCFYNEPIPYIYIQNDAWGVYCTGYTHCKGMYPDAAFCTYDGTASAPTFRSAEMYMNYVEACYEKTGKLDATADQYWRAIRKRAKIAEANDGDYMVTIRATNMSIEGQTDWGAYSAGQLVDPMLYCIRRDRRCEFVGEGRRWTDLRRWRALDQMITTPYHQEGMKLWNCDNTNLYTDEQLTYGNAKATVSSPDRSDFLRPHEIAPGDAGYNGFTWRLAHYLDPIELQHLRITSPTSDDAANSTLYQNPYWSLEAGSAALK